MFTLKPLPFSTDALTPHMSEQTLNLHHGKHHLAYVDNLNKLIENTEFASLSLEEIVVKTYNKPEFQKIFNNAGQVFNHNVFWQSLSPNSEDREISGRLLEMINRDFGSLDNFYDIFKVAASSQFGSGWAWLVLNENKLEVIKTANADNPLTQNLKPIIALDVWEHSYYLDYQNRRAEFIEAYLKQMVNWKFADSNLD